MNSREVYQIFVYGSLRSGFQSPAYEYISRYFTLVGEAKVKGLMYDLGNYPAAVPTRDEKYITGELYRVKHENEFSWAIGQLDDYEGVAVAYDEVQLYRRDLTDVYINDQLTQAWIYWYNSSVTGKKLISSGDLIQYLKEKKQS